MERQPKIGAFVLETLTTGMYTNPLDSVREYIQNSFDSILEAEKKNILGPNSGIIEITIDRNKRLLIIKDNGLGIPSSDAVFRLIDIGMSKKTFGEQAGFRGIGRLAGIAYCEKLIFRTSFEGEDECISISFDCEKIRGSITPSTKKVNELSDVIQRNTFQDIEECKPADHFFEVRMEGVKAIFDQFLEITNLETYLSQVTPVEYDSQKFIFAPKVEQWAKQNGLTIPSLKLVIKDKTAGIERQVFKPFKNRYKTKKNNFQIEIKDILFYPQQFNESDHFWMWYAKTDLLGMLDDESVSGLRFRRDNIQIGGPERVAELFPGNEGRLNSWTMGEIHILSKDVIPNARRDGFEANETWDVICRQLQPFVKEHCKACHDASKKTNRPYIKVLSSAEKVLKTYNSVLTNGLSSPQEKEELQLRLDKELEKVKAALGGKKPELEKKELTKLENDLQKAKKTLDKDIGFTIKKLKGNLDRKQRKIIKEIMEILNSTASNIACPKKKSCLEVFKANILKKYQVDN